MKIKIGRLSRLKGDLITFKELVDKSKESLRITTPTEKMGEEEWAKVLTNCFYRLLPAYTATEPAEETVDNIVGTLRTLKQIHKIPPISEDFIDKHFDEIIGQAILIPTVKASDKAVENFNYVIEKKFEPVKRVLRERR